MVGGICGAWNADMAVLDQLIQACGKPGYSCADGQASHIRCAMCVWDVNDGVP